MKRISPFLFFALIAGGAISLVYRDTIFPKTAPQASARSGAGDRGSGQQERDGVRRGDKPVPVTVTQARRSDVPVYLTGVGTMQAHRTATVRAQVSGRLLDVTFREGQQVTRGDVLARIDPVLYQAAFDQAAAKKAIDQALLENARRDAQRYASLAKSEYTSQQQADTSKSQVTQSEAQVRLDQAAEDTARANLDYCTVRAPIDGRTGLRLVDAGNLVSAQDSNGIVVITEIAPIAAVFTLPENTVSEVLAAQASGDVVLEALQNGQSVGTGKLEVVDNQIDQTTGTVKLKGIFANEANRLWPGEFVNVRLRLKTLADAIIVPSAAVQQGASGSYVYLAAPEKTAKLTPVKITQENEREAVIAEGVQAGDTVITAGFASLQDGSKIETGETKQAIVPGAPPRSPAQGEGREERHRRREAAKEPPGSGETAVSRQ